MGTNTQTYTRERNSSLHLFLHKLKDQLGIESELSAP